jgi:four helix bundle protein
MIELKFEKLDVYQVALEFAAEGHRIAAKLPRGLGHIADQLRRSSCSSLTNTAEAATEFAIDEKARIFRIALRSVGESLALIQLVVHLGEITEEEAKKARELGARLIAMLTRMVLRLRGEEKENPLTKTKTKTKAKHLRPG